MDVSSGSYLRTNLAKGGDHCSTVEQPNLTQDNVVEDVETMGWG